MFLAVSKKYGEDTAWKWTSDGADGYTIEPAERAYPGTDVIMTLKADTEEENYAEYLEEPCGHLSHHLLHTHYVDRSGEVK